MEPCPHCGDESLMPFCDCPMSQARPTFPAIEKARPVKRPLFGMNSFESKTPQFVRLTAAFAPPEGTLPPLPPLPPGYDRWVYRGIAWQSQRAVMVTSWDPATDEEWDPAAIFQTRGDADTHYIEAVADHHWICKCADCLLYS